MLASNLVLELARSKMGLSLNEMAGLVNMSLRDYKKIEENKLEPRLKDMIEISKASGKSIEDLFN